MNAVALASRSAIALDERETRTRTRRTTAVSAVLHAVLFACLLLVKTESPESPPLVEITLLEPGEAGAPAALGAPAPAPATTPGMETSGQVDERFQRSAPRADQRPDPQSDVAIADQLAARLATLRSESRTEVASAGGSPSSVVLTAPAMVGGRGGGGGAPLALTRGGGDGGAPALALTRGTGTGGSSALAPASIPARSTAAEAPARGGDAGLRRELAGATMAGPIADRPILSFVRPFYPEWAKRDAVEGTVTLYFIVRPDGSVKENVLVQRTAGFEDFDENARVALRAWRFEPLGRGRTGEQWGTITFRYRLEGGG